MHKMEACPKISTSHFIDRDENLEMFFFSLFFCFFLLLFLFFLLQKYIFWKSNFPMSHNVCLSIPKKILNFLNVRILGNCSRLLLLLTKPLPSPPPTQMRNNFERQGGGEGCVVTSLQHLEGPLDIDRPCFSSSFWKERLLFLFY